MVKQIKKKGEVMSVWCSIDGTNALHYAGSHLDPREAKEIKGPFMNESADLVDLAGSEIRLTEDYMDDLSDKVKNKFELLDKIKELDTENKRLKDLIKEASENALELNKNDDIQCQETKT